jgi:hypothetical protein
MMTTNEVAQVLETILSSPGMNDTVKIDMRISRKNVLLLYQVIERGIMGKESTGLPGILSDEVLNELKSFAEECLEKAGLVELNSKLLQLHQPEKKN